MEILGLSWLGTRTERFDEMRAFAKDVLGLKVLKDEPGVAFFELANGDQFEVFGSDYPAGGHPPSGAVAAFTVADAAEARAELIAAGLEVGELESLMGYTWAYFTAPDGNKYMVLDGTQA
ncbi:MAG: VOC family protein [Gaiellaceae bacterium]